TNHITRYTHTNPPPRPTPYPYTTLFRSRTENKTPKTKLPESKRQTPSSKHQRITKFQAPNRARASSLIQESAGADVRRLRFIGIDRKSTRLNSSHGSISYAVFCLKKKNT